VNLILKCEENLEKIKVVGRYNKINIMVRDIDSKAV